MLLPLLFGLLIASADNTPEKEIEPASKKAADEAMECFVYMDFARMAYAQEPVRSQVVAKLRPYWTKRYKELAAEAGYSADAIMMRPLVIQIESKRLPAVFLRCLVATPEDALR